MSLMMFMGRNSFNWRESSDSSSDESKTKEGKSVAENGENEGDGGKHVDNTGDADADGSAAIKSVDASSESVPPPGT